MTVNRKYIVLQGLFWMLYCIAGSFLSLYLQANGLSNQSIGIVSALFGTVSAILQPALGRLCDHSSRFTWKNLLIIITGVFFCECVLMLTLSGSIVNAILMGLLLLTGNLMMPLVNGAMSYYQQQNETIHFGIARGTGSGMYALAAFLIGNLAGIHGVRVIPAIGLAVSILFLLCILQMPCGRSLPSKTEAAASANRDFLKRYPAFLVMTAAFILVSASHNIVSVTYLLQIIQALGGGSGELGTAMSIQAIVEIPVLFGFGLLLKRFRPKTLMAAASLGYGLKAVLYAIAQNMTAIYLIQLTQILSFAIFASASVYYVLDTVGEKDQITGQALMTSTMAAGNVLGSLIGGWILDAFGISWMLRSNVILAAAGIFLALLSCRMSNILQKEKPNHPNHEIFSH